MPVFEQDDLPDLIDRQVLFPRRHDRGPWEGFARETDSALRHPPEHEGLLELRDRPGVGEVRGNRVEGKGKHAPAVQIIAVAEVAVLEEDLPAFPRSEEHTSELQSLAYLVCRL